MITMFQGGTIVNLAGQILDTMKEPRSLHLDGGPTQFKVVGYLPVGETLASVTVRVDNTWLNSPLSAWCHERWLRRGEQDWHTSENGFLCYVFDDEWRDRLQEIANSRGVLLASEVAAIWFTRNVQWLLSKHILADQCGIIKWPPEWTACPHNYSAALKSYLRNRRGHGSRDRVK